MQYSESLKGDVRRRERGEGKGGREGGEGEEEGEEGEGKKRRWRGEYLYHLLNQVWP